MDKSKTLSKPANIKARDVFVGKRFYGNVIYDPKRLKTTGTLFTKAEILKAGKRFDALKKKFGLVKLA